MSDPISDLHDQLMKEFRLYFSANQKWAAKQTHVSGIELRKHLSNISKICLELRLEIQRVRETKPKIKSPKYKQSLLKEKENTKDT